MGGGKVREPRAGIAAGLEMCRKQGAGARCYPGGCIAGLKGAKHRANPDPQHEGAMWHLVASS